MNARILITFTFHVAQHGHQGLCHLNLSGMIMICSMFERAGIEKPHKNHRLGYCTVADFLS